MDYISNNSSLHQKYTGVPDGFDSCDGESDMIRRQSDWSCCVPPLWRLSYNVCHSCEASLCILRSPLRRQAPCTLIRDCGDVYTQSEPHVCYTLRRGCCFAVGVHTTPGDVYAFLRPKATCRTLIYVYI